MAPISPGKPSTALRRTRKPDSTGDIRRHRFEPFSRRIARLKIDPIHRVDHSQTAAFGDDLSQSQFRSSLDHWADLNLSQNYTEFARQAEPLCESLPQLLYHADELSALLVQHIEKLDAVSLEPLLALVAHFAHDLGPAFEKYFERLVRLIAHVAATHGNADVIEWSFTCLTWIFKFLSRLLVPDLRSILGIMLPFLQSRKAHIARFTAESLAFLLRKAATMSSRNQGPLKLAMSYLLNAEWDHSSETNSQLGLMTLIAEAAKASERYLHASASQLLWAACDEIDSHPGGIRRQLTILEGVVTNLIHHTDSQTFLPIEELVCRRTRLLSRAATEKQLLVVQSLLWCIVATRKASRISLWPELFQTLSGILSLQPRAPLIEAQRWISMIASTLSYAPMGELLPYLTTLSCQLTELFDTRSFYAFCESMANINFERYEVLVAPILKKYITAHWNEYEENTCVVLQAIQGTHLKLPQTHSDTSLLPPGWADRAAEILENSDTPNSPKSVALANAFLRVFLDSRNDQTITVPIQLFNTLKQKLEDALSISQNAGVSDMQKLILGPGFTALQVLSGEGLAHASEYWSSFASLSEIYFKSDILLEALCKYAAFASPVHCLKDGDLLRMTDILIENLLVESTHLKNASLDLLTHLLQAPDEKFHATITLGKEILATRYSPGNARTIAMLVRRLPQHHRSVGQRYKHLVPYMALGLPAQYHDETRQCVCDVIAEIAQNPEDETAVFGVAIKWLEASASPTSVQEPSVELEKIHPSSVFECSNALNVARTVEDSFSRQAQPCSVLEELFQRGCSFDPATIPRSSRSLALQILQSIPEIAEKRSRLWVAVFLSAWSEQNCDLSLPESDVSVSSRTLSPNINEESWQYSDRKMFLELLGRFRNPKVLYRATDVHDTLMRLLKQGNSVTQRLALKALFCWEDATLNKFEDDLLSLLDEKMYTHQINQLLTSSDLVVEPADRGKLMEIMLRLLYGQMVGRPGTFGSQELKRKATIRALFRLPHKDFSHFLQIALGRVAQVQTPQAPESQMLLLDHDIVPLDQQYGLLRMMHSIMEISQDQFRPFTEVVAGPILYCLVRSCRHLDVKNGEESKGVTMPKSSLAHYVRKTALQCLDRLFKASGSKEWHSYISLLYSEVISPRLSRLAIETAQGLSWILRIFATWCQTSNMLHFISDFDDRTVEAIWRCLELSSVKDEVKIYVLDNITLPIAETAEAGGPETDKAVKILTAQMQPLLTSMTTLLQSKPSKDLISSALLVLPRLAPFTNSAADIALLLEVLISTLDDNTRKLSPKMKGLLVIAVARLVDNPSIQLEQDLKMRLWLLTAELLSYFKDIANRQTCAGILASLAKEQTDLNAVAQLCMELNAGQNAISLAPNYDEQIDALRKIQDHIPNLSNRWLFLPIINTLMYFSKASEDFAVRTNAVSCLRRLLLQVLENPKPDLVAAIDGKVLPAITAGLRENSESVRADFVGLLGLLVQHGGSNFHLEDLSTLLVHNDEEASFFSNVLHIQQHRRLRALHRLGVEVEKGVISARNVWTFFVPLVEKFLKNIEDDVTAQTLKGQSLVTLGLLLKWIEWPQFRSMLRKFRTALDAPGGSEKDAIKLLGIAANALSSAVEANMTQSDVGNFAKSHLATTLSSTATIMAELKVHHLPRLANFVHLRDESQLSLRLPVAVVAIKLTKLLPSDEAAVLMPPVILDVCQTLRSRVQESRDVARRTLTEIVSLIGPSSMLLVLKELKTSLNRGYQLHVLSYTVHSILVESIPKWTVGCLDYCLSNIVGVVMEDIFGNVGQEKENQDYISSMKEVKSSKSFDTLELLAKISSVASLYSLIQPLQALLEGPLSAKQSRQTDELLRRIGIGITRNAGSNSQDILTFAYQVLQEIYNKRIGVADKPVQHQNRERYIVQSTAAQKSSSSFSSSQTHKVTRFALDIVRTTLQKHAELLIASNVHGFLPIIGDVLLTGQEDVKTSGLRLLTTLVKLPMAELDDNAQLYISEAVNIMKSSDSTSSEASQAALKLVSTVIRDRKSAIVRDADLAYLLHLVTPDLEEPDRQGVTFNFVKAIMSRRVMLPEVYEIVDKVGTIMVVNHTRSTRDVARGIYINFLLEYPQSKSRWSKQLKFLLKNIEYKHQEGRQSVMEAINGLLSKTTAVYAEDIVTTYFIPVLLRMANDESEECRNIARALLGQMFRKAYREQSEFLFEPLRAWIQPKENVALTKMALRAYQVFIETCQPEGESQLPLLRRSLTSIFRASRGDQENTANPLLEALQLFHVAASEYPAQFLSSKQSSLWDDVCTLHTCRDPEIQTAIADLLGLWFQDITKINTVSTLNQVPLKGSQGLELNSPMMIKSLKQSLWVLKRQLQDGQLVRLTIRNCLFLGRCLCLNGATISCRKLHSPTSLEANSSNDSDSEADGILSTESIPAAQYLVHQCSSILRREPAKYTTPSLIPKRSTLTLLVSLVPQMSIPSLKPELSTLMATLLHLTDPATIAPRSADPQFAETYHALVSGAHELLETIQTHVGDVEYVRSVTEASRMIRDRRQERRSKRAIGRVSEPEAAARKKSRNSEKKRDRKKELVGSFRRGRKGL